MQDNSFTLTPREAEIMVMVCQGMTNAAIAEMLGVSRRTVGKHLENVFVKLEVTNRTGAAVAFRRRFR